MYRVKNSTCFSRTIPPPTWPMYPMKGRPKILKIMSPSSGGILDPLVRRRGGRQNQRLRRTCLRLPLWTRRTIWTSTTWYIHTQPSKVASNYFSSWLYWLTFLKVEHNYLFKIYLFFSIEYIFFILFFFQVACVIFMVPVFWTVILLLYLH